MAKISVDKRFVTVEKNDTLSEIAQDFAGGVSKVKQLAAINNIVNIDFISIGQKIYLTASDVIANATPKSSNKPTIKQFGLISTSEDTLYATWEWTKSKTASYKVLWTYDTGNGVWFEGSNSTINVDKDAPELSRQSTYQIPKNAKRVQFKVKPISETYTKNKKETSYWTAEWSDVRTYTDSTPLETPASVPSVSIKKYQLTASLDSVNVAGATHIQFQVVKNNSANVFATNKSAIVTNSASYAFTVDAGAEYKVRCRAYDQNSNTYSDWTGYSSNITSMPATPASIKKLEAKSKTSVYLEWDSVATADTYDIEYTTEQRYFDGSDQTDTKTGIESTHFEITGLETGTQYFFRVRAVKGDQKSGWCEPQSVVIGKDPAAPTTWSSSTTVVAGEPLTLYWVHNAEDGSSQTLAELELYIDGTMETHTVENSTDEDEKDRTSFFNVDTSAFVEGTQIQWRVRTAGITKVYGDWSIQRTIDIYAPATLVLSIVDGNDNPVEVLTSFPFYVKGLPGPKTQIPTGYHLTITSDDTYETVDNTGNSKMVNSGEELYSKYFDIDTDLMVEMSAYNLNLDNNISYTVTCTVSMNSGLTATVSLPLTVTWADEQYAPNAEIGIDEDSLTAHIQPYCEERKLVYRKVNLSEGQYLITDEVLAGVYGSSLPGIKTTTGEQVYSGTTVDDETVYYCEVEEITPVADVLLSVYRREFDGTFTELATGLDSSKYTTITDPHPALDYARYRIVATSKTTGSISYYDPPGYPVGGTAVVIQWAEEWIEFETSEAAPLVQPSWSGSLLKLPYNIDVSDDNSPDVVLVKYAGREHPVSYYGTHVGHKATWNMEIDKNDTETLYALRRLQRWMGDVYVREPSGSGYWANITVSYSQKHKGLTIPVTFSVKRVEGGM